MTKASAALPPKHPLYAPGLRIRPRQGEAARYWIPAINDVKKGFAPKSITFRPDQTEEEIAEACRKYQANLHSWRAGLDGPTRYSITWLINRYTKDEFSPYQRLSHGSQQNYDQCLLIIDRDIGKVLLEPDGLIPSIVGEDVWRWHKKWGRPDKDGKVTMPSRARHLITQFKMLIKYAVTIPVPGAAELLMVLKAMEFPTTTPRLVAPTFGQVVAIVKKAVEMGFASIAVTTLAQFEFVERRISIIGNWEGEQWKPGWVWSGVQHRSPVGISPDWIVSYYQNKVGAVRRVYDLKDTPFLLQLLQQVPEDQRAGPIILCETTGKPWKEKHYTDTFRRIARAAEVPDDVWSMDMRAGGATETDGIPGITERHIKDAGGWSSDAFNRYRRAKHLNAQNVVKLRQEARETGIEPTLLNVRPVMPDLSGWTGDAGVYLIQCEGGERHVKIGYTTDLSQRFKALITGCPYPVKLIGTHAGPIALERYLHWLFRAHRVNGEWFLPAPEVLRCAKVLPKQSRKRMANE